MTENIITTVESVPPVKLRSNKLAKAEFISQDLMGSGGYPYTYEDVDKLEVLDIKKYRESVEACRFFYKKDPIAGTVINKMIDIGINDFVFDKGSLSDNEFRIFAGLKPRLVKFASECALELLTTGLVVPEIQYKPLTKSEIKSFGIKKYETITAPTSLWIRDSKTIIVNAAFSSDAPSYFVEVPDELAYFIKTKGQYEDGTMDKEAYLKLLTAYPEFVRLVESGEKYIKLDNPLITRLRYIPDSPYPIPYLYPALEAMKHKRNLRRMDYSIAARVITAIMQVAMGDKDFPLTEEDQDQVDYLKNQMRWRDGTNINIEKVFQLFTNHTVKISWIFPDTSALLNEVKYINVNEDIFLSLGFPRILTTGETQRTGSSDPEFATISPVRTMEYLRSLVLSIIKKVVNETSEMNGFKGTPVISFANMNLHSFADFVSGMTMLYNTGNISRTSLDSAFGYHWEEEIKTKANEDDLMEELGVGEFAPQPFSQQPGQPGGAPGEGNNAPNQQKKQQKEKEVNKSE